MGCSPHVRVLCVIYPHSPLCTLKKPMDGDPVAGLEGHGRRHETKLLSGTLPGGPKPSGEKTCQAIAQSGACEARAQN